MPPTRALSIRPQWVQAILHLGKRIECRDWPEGYAALGAARRLAASGETVYLHAGLGSRAEYEADAADIAARGLGRIVPWSEAVRGALAGTFRIETVIDDDFDGDRVDPWDNGAEVGLILADVIPLAFPIQWTGKLGFFHVDLGPKDPPLTAEQLANYDGADGFLGFGDPRDPRPTPPAPPIQTPPAAPDPAARRSEAARKANATRKARKLASAAPAKPATDWSEAGRKAYKTRLRNAAARGDREAAVKLASGASRPPGKSHKG